MVCDDDGALGGGQTSQFTFRALANVPYYLVVDGKDGPGDLATAGAYRLELQLTPVPSVPPMATVHRVASASTLSASSVGMIMIVTAIRPVMRIDVLSLLLSVMQTIHVLRQISSLVPSDSSVILPSVSRMGICVEQGMCRQPIPIQLGDVIEGDNFGRERIYGANCGDGGAGAEVIYSFEAPADGEACFSIVSADYDAVIYLKDICATNPAVFSTGFLACEDTAGNEAPGAIDDRFDYQLTAGETYYFVVDSNEPDNEGTFTFFTHYGLCGAVPAPQCESR